MSTGDEGSGLYSLSRLLEGEASGIAYIIYNMRRNYSVSMKLIFTSVL